MKRIKLKAYPIAILLLTLIVAGCAHLRIDFEEPTVKVVSLRALPADGMEQKFAIGLSITNPNAIALNLVGMSYRLSLKGYDLLGGVANDIPEIPAYSEVPLEITTSVNLLNSLRFIQSLLTEPADKIDYQLSAKLELNSKLWPAIRLVEKGEIALTR